MKKLYCVFKSQKNSRRGVYPEHGLEPQMDSLFILKAIAHTRAKGWFGYKILCHLLMEETEGTLFFDHIPSERSQSLISHANIVGFSRLYFTIASFTGEVVTFGLLPPIAPALNEPVLRYL